MHHQLPGCLYERARPYLFDFCTQTLTGNMKFSHVERFPRAALSHDASHDALTYRRTDPPDQRQTGFTSPLHECIIEL